MSCVFYLWMNSNTWSYFSSQNIYIRNEPASFTLVNSTLTRSEKRSMEMLCFLLQIRIIYFFRNRLAFVLKAKMIDLICTLTFLRQRYQFNTEYYNSSFGHFNFRGKHSPTKKYFQLPLMFLRGDYQVSCLRPIRSRLPQRLNRQNDVEVNEPTQLW